MSMVFSKCWRETHKALTVLVRAYEAGRTRNIMVHVVSDRGLLLQTHSNHDNDFQAVGGFISHHFGRSVELVLLLVPDYGVFDLGI